MKSPSPSRWFFILMIAIWLGPLAAAEQYTCPMHPHYISEDSEGTCPICGMALVALESGPALDAGDASEASRQITISPETIQNMGVRTQAAERVRFGREVRSFGLVEVDTRLQTVISGRVDGWLEDLKIRAVGDPIRRGMLLFRLYSPDLISAQRDLLSALKGTSKQRIKSAERRLLSLGVGKQLIESLKESQEVVDLVPFYADASGLVSELPVQQGAYIRPGTTITRIQSYSRVWLNASVPEKDLSLLKTKGRAMVTFPNLPGRYIDSKIDYIHPVVDSGSRTGQVRLVLDNREGDLRPGSYADVVFYVDELQRIAVADEALLVDAAGTHIMIALGEGRFEARSVKTGLSTGGFTEITAGVSEGEPVVISGQFLLDSESSLRESFTKLKRMQTPFELLVLSNSQMAMVDHLIDAALYIHEGIVDGYDLKPNMLQASRDIKAPLLKHFGDTQLGFLLNDADSALIAAMASRSQSQLFSALNQLVTTLRPWMIEGRPDHYQQKGVTIFQDKASNQLWLQADSEPYNPYGEGEALLISAGESDVQKEKAGE